MLAKKIKSKRVFKGHEECVIVTEYWDGMTTQEYFGKKGYEKTREKFYDGMYDRWLCNGYAEIKTKSGELIEDPYECPACGETPLMIKEIETDPDVVDDVLHCEKCGKHFAIVPGDEVEG